MKRVSKEQAPVVPATRKPQIIVFGDSHSHAIQRAIQKRKGKNQPVSILAYRLLKEKNGGQIGDTSFEDFLKSIARLGSDDVVVSVIGGNQHAVLSTIQHPRPFDFFLPGRGSGQPGPDVEIVPYRALVDLFQRGLSNSDGKSLKAIRDATIARMVHIAPPPPKADNAFIEQNHESLFASEGIAARGVSPPELRLKFWLLQIQVLRRLCARLGIELMLPPKNTVSEGFLRPQFYAQDATHANWRYGERLLRAIEGRYIADQANWAEQ